MQAVCYRQLAFTINLIAMTLVIDVKNDSEVLPIIKKWEAEHDIEILSTSDDNLPKRSELFRGKLSKETGKMLLEDAEQSRREWD